MALEDLAVETLARALPGRPLRSYPALLSAQADALAWARAGAQEGAVVVADYQASARGRGGLTWSVVPGEGLCFSLVLRPDLPLEREGWLYVVALSGVADVLGKEARLEWPDEVHLGGVRSGAVGVHVEPGPAGCEWAVASVLLPGARPPRARVLADAVTAIEERYRSRPAAVLAEYLRRCATVGRAVRARLIPLGPGGPSVAGTAVTMRHDGSLVLEKADGRRVAVPPQALGLLEDVEPGELGADEL